MAEDTDFIEQRNNLLESIEADQKDVRVAIQELTDAAHSTLDVGERIRKFPLPWLLGGFFVGLWLGSRIER